MSLPMTRIICSALPSGSSVSPSSLRSSHDYMMDLCVLSRSSGGIETVAGPSSRILVSARSDARSAAVHRDDSCFSIYTSPSGNSKWLSKSNNDGSCSSFLKTRVLRRRKGRVSSALVSEVGNVDIGKITETKEEMLLERSQKPRVESTYLDKAGQPKLISVQDYMELAPDFIKPNSGPPRWFCSMDAKGYPPDAPLLLFVPGMDSLGLGLLLHQKKLARLFEVQCLHVPIDDRTSFLGLLEIIEKRIREEIDHRPGPVYILGESFGGCIALALAARNPNLDLVLVIVNAATSFANSPLQPLIPLLHVAPDELLRVIPYLLSFTLGDPVKMASASVDSDLPPWEKIPKVAEALTALLPTLPVLSEIMPRETLIWKIKLINDGARYANSRIRGVHADILLLASGKDQMLPSRDEARRLKKLLPQIRIRYFPNSGHTLLLEEGVDVASLIKSTQLLRHKKNTKFDPVKDFRPPFPDEIELVRNSSIRIIRQLFSPVFLSITEKGQVRRGLPQLPEGRPLLLVSNHTLIGFDLGIVVDEFLKHKGVLLRGLAHPLLSADGTELQEPGGADLFRLFGTVPVTGSNLYKILARGEAALLYPGGVREALKLKGEAYKLYWSESAEFVRTAIRHKATIIPFASVGGDDIVEILLDRKDLLSIPFLTDYIKKSTSKIPLARTTGTGEVTNESFIAPLGYPKIPPRMYFLFEKPIPTDGMADSINDRALTSELYFKVKADVESSLDYLLQKRSQDPYRDFIPRAIYEATNDSQAPTFEF